MARPLHGLALALAAASLALGCSGSSSTSDGGAGATTDAGTSDAGSSSDAGNTADAGPAHPFLACGGAHGIAADDGGTSVDGGPIATRVDLMVASGPRSSLDSYCVEIDPVGTSPVYVLCGRYGAPGSTVTVGYDFPAGSPGYQSEYTAKLLHVLDAGTDPVTDYLDGGASFTDVEVADQLSTPFGPDPSGFGYGVTVCVSGYDLDGGP